MVNDPEMIEEMDLIQRRPLNKISTPSRYDLSCNSSPNCLLNRFDVGENMLAVVIPLVKCGASPCPDEVQRESMFMCWVVNGNNIASYVFV